MKLPFLHSAAMYKVKKIGTPVIVVILLALVSVTDIAVLSNISKNISRKEAFSLENYDEDYEIAENISRPADNYGNYDTEPDAQYESEYNNDIDSATVVRTNTMYTGYLSDSRENGEQDWFVFTLSKGGMTHLYFNSEKQKKDGAYWHISMGLANDPDNPNDNYSVTSGSLPGETEKNYLGPGTYFIMIESDENYSSDTYNFKVVYDDSAKLYTGTFNDYYNNIMYADLAMTCDDDFNISNVIFHFYPHPLCPDMPEGSYYMNAQVEEIYDDDTAFINLTADRWNVQPENAEMLDFSITLDIYNGTIVSLDKFLTLMSDEGYYKLADSYEDNVVEFGGHRYCVFDSEMSWGNAELFCSYIGGHLVSVTSLEEQEFVQNIAYEYSDEKGLWIGCYNNGTGWVWSDGSDYVYSNWGEDWTDDRASDDYYEVFARMNVDDNMYAEAGKWDDACLSAGGSVDSQPLESIGFICEWEY